MTNGRYNSRNNDNATSRRQSAQRSRYNDAYGAPNREASNARVNARSSQSQRPQGQRQANSRSGQFLESRSANGAAYQNERQYDARSARQASSQGGQANRDARQGARQVPMRDERQSVASYRPVNYRQARQDASQKRLTRAVCGAAAVLVVVAVAFGVMAVTHNGSGSGSGGQAASESLAQSVVADAQGGNGSQAASSAASTSTGNAALDNRAQDFAVDPNRTDWNYSTNGKKTVYLTIDDGPSAMTPQVLDILDRYGCKATFFVVGHNEDCFPYIAEAFKRGHTIGLHTMTHDYAYVYSSVDAYYEDLESIGNVVKEQIGFVPCFIRFPGGSSNMVSASYSPGIMTTLSEDVQAKGYQYYDWNLSVGDGSEHTAEEIAGYGMADEGNENIMLLCHDSATKQSTVDALPQIIEHYQSLGYTFEAIDRSSWVCHHGVSN